jgi:hypothetical protein
MKEPSIGFIEEEDIDVKEQDDDTLNAMTCTTIVNKICCN